MRVMRLRTLAMALTLAFGATNMVRADSAKKPTVRQAKKQNRAKFKQSKASKIKPRKATKSKPSRRG